MTQIPKGFRQLISESNSVTYSGTLSLKDLEDYLADVFLDKIENIINNYTSSVWAIPMNSPIKAKGDYLISIELPDAKSKSSISRYLNKDFIFTAQHKDCKDLRKKEFKVVAIEAFAINDEIPQTKYGLLIKENNGN